MRIVVCRLEDFPPGERRIVQAGRRSIGVFRVGDNFYALNNYCPHQGGPLCLGATQSWIRSSKPGEYQLEDGEALVACPWHGWEYDLATGQSFLGPEETPARTYDVSVEDIPESERKPAGVKPKGGRIPGPYVAETFAVEVEGPYVVVETTSGAKRRTNQGGGQ